MSKTSEVSEKLNDASIAIKATAGVLSAIFLLADTVMDELKKKGTLPNIKFPTLGGKVFWDTIAERNGLKVQKNKITGHCRILDSDNFRLAWGGSEEALLAELQKLANQTSGNT